MTAGNSLCAHNVKRRCLAREMCDEGSVRLVHGVVHLAHKKDMQSQTWKGLHWICIMEQTLVGSMAGCI